MRCKPRTAVIVAALLIGVAVVPLAGASGPMPGTEVVNMTLPPNSSGTVTRAPMPASSTTGTIAVKTNSDDADFIDTLTTVLRDDKPTFGARAVHCVLMYAKAVSLHYSDVSSEEETTHSLDDLFLHVCLRLALDISQQSGAASHAAGAATTARCGVRNAAVSVTITKTGSGYQAILHGTPYTSKPRSVRVSCTHTATGLKITEKARRRGGKLAKAIGPIIGVGFSSTSGSSGKLKIALGVR